MIGGARRPHLRSELGHFGVKQLPCPECPRTLSSCRQETNLSLEMRAFPGISSSRFRTARELKTNMNGHLAAKKQEIPNAASERDPLYLFVCFVEWRKHGGVREFEELLAALDDPNEEVRLVAESLVDRLSPSRAARHSG